MEIEISDSSAYNRYEELLVLRDQLLRECNQLRAQYLHEFGELMVRNFEKKVACIQKKKILSFAQMIKNRGEQVDMQAVCDEINVEMEEYYRQLSDLTEAANACKKLQRVPEHISRDVKRVYRELAKMLHPDMNSITNSNPKLLDLWNEIVAAYYQNDLNRLMELRVLANQALRDCKAGDTALDIPDIEGKIKKLEEEIHSIVTTDPYQYKELLESDRKTEDKIKELQEEYVSYTVYVLELDIMLNNLK